MTELVQQEAYQTLVADLLETKLQQSGLGSGAKIVLSKLAEEIGVSEPTLRKWLSARYGSNEYLWAISPDVEGKLMRFFGLTDTDQLYRRVTVENADSPSSLQETVAAGVSG